MILRLLFLPLVIVVRLLSAPFRAWRRRVAAPPGALVEIVVAGAVAEGPARPSSRWSLARWLRRPRRASLRLPTVRRTVDEVLSDPRAAGVLLTIRNVGGGWAGLEALRAEVGRVRSAGKRLVAWLPEGGGDREIFVATAAQLVVAPPTVDLALTGTKSERHFIKRGLDRLGVDVEVHARKEYKSAGDGMIREQRSEADRAQTEAIIGAIDHALVAAIGEGRGVDPLAARALVDAGPTRASVAKERGLVDLLGHDDELPTLLGARLIPADRYLARRGAGRAPRPWFGRRKVIAIVEVHGAIASTHSPLARALGPVAAAEQVVADLRAAERDPRVAGVVLDVDSRGGTVTASDAIYAAARRLAQKKPVVARMGDYAASGGYYVAAAARSIVARPLTLTGSIGVVAVRPIVARLAETLGITRDVVARGRYADAGALTRPPTDDERALFDREIDGHYAAFVSIVAEARARSVEEIEPLARGRVWTGADAHARGLVDHLGGLDRAVSLVREALPGIAVEPEPRVIAAHVPGRRLDDGPRAAAALASVLDWLPLEVQASLAPFALAPARIVAWMP